MQLILVSATYQYSEEVFISNIIHRITFLCSSVPHFKVLESSPVKLHRCHMEAAYILCTLTQMELKGGGGVYSNRTNVIQITHFTRK